MVKSWKKCRISIALDGTDELLWDYEANDSVNEYEDNDDPMADDGVDQYDNAVQTEEWEELFGPKDNDKENYSDGF